MTKIILLFSNLFFITNALAQTFLNESYSEINIHAGKVIENHPAFPEVNSASYVAGIRAGFKLNGSKPWHKNYGYPDVGLNFIFGNIGNKKVLGNEASLLPEMSFRQKLTGRWHLSESVGMGISYFNKPYNQVENPENIIIGSHVTFCALAAVNFEYQLNKNFIFNIRPCLYHSSNSHSALPNVGLNLPLIGAGLRYTPVSNSSVRTPDTTFIYDKKIHFNIRFGLAMNEQGGATGPANGPKYPIYLASLFLTKNFSTVNKVHAGLEGWYNTGVYDYITSQDFYDDNEKIKSTAFALILGHEFLMGHFSFVTQGGIYLYNPFYKEKLRQEQTTSFKAKLKTIILARIGYQFYLFDATLKQHHNLYAGIYIKTNLGQADFLDTSIGYTF